MKKQIPIFLLIAVIFTGGGFFSGTKYQQTKRSSLAGQFGSGQFRNGQGGTRQGQTQGNRAGFRPVNGDIISADDISITVKMQDGSITAQNIQLNPIARDFPTQSQ